MDKLFLQRLLTHTYKVKKNTDNNFITISTNTKNEFQYLRDSLNFSAAVRSVGITIDAFKNSIMVKEYISKNKERFQFKIPK